MGGCLGGVDGATRAPTLSVDETILKQSKKKSGRKTLPSGAEYRDPRPTPSPRKLSPATVFDETFPERQVPTNGLVNGSPKRRTESAVLDYEAAPAKPVATVPARTSPSPSPRRRGNSVALDYDSPNEAPVQPSPSPRRRKNSQAIDYDGPEPKQKSSSPKKRTPRGSPRRKASLALDYEKDPGPPETTNVALIEPTVELTYNFSQDMSKEEVMLVKPEAAKESSQLGPESTPVPDMEYEETHAPPRISLIQRLSQRSEPLPPKFLSKDDLPDESAGEDEDTFVAAVDPKPVESNAEPEAVAEAALEEPEAAKEEPEAAKEEPAAKAEPEAAKEEPEAAAAEEEPEAALEEPEAAKEEPENEPEPVDQEPTQEDEGKSQPDDPSPASPDEPPAFPKKEEVPVKMERAHAPVNTDCGGLEAPPPQVNSVKLNFDQLAALLS